MSFVVQVHLLQAPVYIFHSVHKGGFHERLQTVSNPTLLDVYRYKLKLNREDDWGVPKVRFREIEFRYGIRVTTAATGTATASSAATAADDKPAGANRKILADETDDEEES